MRHATVAYVLGVALALSACAEFPSDKAEIIEIVKVEVTAPQGRDTIRALGDTLRLRARVLDGAGTPIERVPLIWKSDNTAIATVVDTSGLVTSVANGTANITATLKDDTTKTGTVKITVKQKADRIGLSPSPVPLTVGKTVVLTAEVRDSKQKRIVNPVIAWLSDKPDIATIDGTTRKVTGKAVGRATITATVDGVTGTTHVSVDK